VASATTEKIENFIELHSGMGAPQTKQKIRI